MRQETSISAMKALTQAEIADFLAHEPLWCFADGKLVRDWLFEDFVAAMEFVNRVAALAEEAGHHPDIDIRYSRVRLGLVTHDAGGVTVRDSSMAERLSHEFPA
jgi:4a-hydroxytetrahydrobiopterin dehydratase